MKGNGTTDFTVSGAGSVFIVTPETEEAERWVEDHIGEDAMRFCGGVVVEHRYVADVVQGILDDGLTVE